MGITFQYQDAFSGNTHFILKIADCIDNPNMLIYICNCYYFCGDDPMIGIWSLSLITKQNASWSLQDTGFREPTANRIGGPVFFISYECDL